MEDPKLGHNKEQSFIEFSTHEGKMKIGKEGNSLFIEQNETKVFMDESISGPDVTAAARTNNPIVAGDTPNENIDVLDAAIGADVAPVVRTNHPVVQNTTVLTKVAALDACIGTDGDIIPAARTTGGLVQNSTVNAKFKAIDDAIGSDAQMPDSSKIVDHDLDIFQNLRALDTYKSVETIKKTIGGVGVNGCDFNFATAGDQAEQVIDLGEIIPSLARVLDCFARTNNEFTGAVSLAAEIGTTNSGHELVGSATIFAADAIIAMAHDHGFTITPTVAAGRVYVAVTPGANWSLVTAGKVTIYITYINIANI